MFDYSCPFRPVDHPCEVELELMIQNKADEEATEFYYEAQTAL